MKKGNRNLIYAYDDESHTIIIIDAETGEEIDQHDNRVLSILNYLQDEQQPSKLRRFALWCAAQSNDDIKPQQKKFFTLAEQAVKGETSRQDLQKLYEDSEGEAIATDTVGLRQGSMRAPGFLASRECVNPDAFEGAKNAARFHCLWAEMQRDDHGLPDGLQEVRPAASEETIDKIEQQQIDFLLDLIGE